MDLLKRPSAWIPIAMPIGIIAMLMYHLTVFGIVREADEGTAAHIFQLWLVVQAFAMAYFAFTWLPRDPRAALVILILQFLGAVLAAAPVFLLEL